MANVFDYLEWRGDLSFSSSPWSGVFAGRVRPCVLPISITLFHSSSSLRDTSSFNLSLSNFITSPFGIYYCFILCGIPKMSDNARRIKYHYFYQFFTKQVLTKGETRVIILKLLLGKRCFSGFSADSVEKVKRRLTTA